MKIIIPGDPIAKARPRFARRGQFVSTYNVQETEEGRALLLCRDQIKEQFTGPIEASLWFFIRRPKSHYGTGRNAEILKKTSPVYPSVKPPDVDNYVKFYLDILNGVAWVDDAQICYIKACKRFCEIGKQPSTVIMLQPLVSDFVTLDD